MFGVEDLDCDRLASGVESCFNQFFHDFLRSVEDIDVDIRLEEIYICGSVAAASGSSGKSDLDLRIVVNEFPDTINKGSIEQQFNNFGRDLTPDECTSIDVWFRTDPPDSDPSVKIY